MQLILIVTAGWIFGLDLDFDREGHDFKSLP